MTHDPQSAKQKLDHKPKENRYRKIERLFPVFMVIAIIAIPLSIVLAITIGAVHISFINSFRILIDQMTGHPDRSFSAAYDAIIWQARVPRILMAAVVGAGLAMCGAVMQASVQNPLADPYIIGTSAGATLGATFVILLGLGGITWVQGISVPVGAFVGAMGASFLVLAIANTGGKMTSVKLVLSGVVLGMICSSFSQLIYTWKPNDEGMRAVSYWLMGSLAPINWTSFDFRPILILVAVLFFLSQGRIMNVMMLGDEAAATLGIDLTKYRLVYMIVASLLVGIIVTICGLVGYVGLIIPHIARGLVGTDHRKMLPLSICLGAVFLIWCDVAARSILVGSELPLGLITSIIGAPILMYRIVKQGFGSTDK